MTGSKTAAAIRQLNDQLRQDFSLGVAVMTVGIAALGCDAVRRIIQTVATYDDFCRSNDPHEEHDFGAFEAEDAKIFFKIDYFNKTMDGASPDPSDPLATTRVITVMLADEY